MHSLIRLLPTLLPCLLPIAGIGAAIHRHVVVIVWDGMRPDFISDQNTPMLAQLARRGVTFRDHHSVYLSATEVNGTAISTGAYPSHDGIIGNKEYRPEIDPMKPIHTEAIENVRKGDLSSHGRYVRVPTMAELVRKAGGNTVVAGAKPVVLLADRAARDSAARGANLFAGAALPFNLMAIVANRLGTFPGELSLEPTRNDWTTSGLLDVLWSDNLPAFTFLWMNQPDLSQHLTGPGSEGTLATLRNADQNLARLLRAIEAKGAGNLTDVIIVSDHGASTVASRVDVAEFLSKAGVTATREFKTRPSSGEVLVVSNGGSSFIYVVGHERKVVEQIVRLLQQAEFSGVILCRESMPGAFKLSEAHLDSEAAPDVVVSMRWNADKNKNGTPGKIASDVSSFGPGQGSHVSLSPFDMHATLVAAGPDFRPGVVDSLPSGNVDIAPTVLWILGLRPPKSMDGRVLSEALTIQGPQIHSFNPRRIESSVELNDSTWLQYLDYTEVNGVRYLNEGNGQQTRN